MATSAEEVREACKELSTEMCDALHAVRERVRQDRLPLLSLLQVAPLQLQSSHLSFQEYFAARALCEAGTVLSGSPPWQWPAWWSNALSLGAEMGDDFRLGLLRTAGVAGGTLDLSNGQLGGDRETALRVVVELMAVLTELDVRTNQLGPEDAKAFADALCVNASLTKLSLAMNDLGEPGTKSICDALKDNKMLKELDLSGDYRGSNIGGSAGAKHVADMLGVNASLTKISLAQNNLAEEGIKVICDVVKGNTTLKELNLAGGFTSGTNIGGPAGAKHVADMLGVNASLTTLNLADNAIGGHYDKGEFISTPEGPKAIADALLVNASLTRLDVSSNYLDRGGHGVKMLRDAVCGRQGFTLLDDDND